MKTIEAGLDMFCGARVRLTALVDVDGAIIYWDALDPDTGASVDLKPWDRWNALAAIYAAGRRRGE